MPVRSSHSVQGTSAIAKERTSVKQNENRKVSLCFSHVGDVKLLFTGISTLVHFYRTMHTYM